MSNEEEVKPSKQTRFYINKLKPLRGFIVCGFTYDATSDPTEEQHYGIILKDRSENKKVLWLLRDDEGNGPGSFEIQSV